MSEQHMSNVPMSLSNLRQLRLRTLFAWTLVVVTAWPFVTPFVQGVGAVKWTIMFLALIHVPMTCYLLADRAIRERLRRRPMVMVVVPMALFGLTFYVYAQPHKDGNWIYMPFTIFMLAWQHWHFGKQNVGVYSFLRIAHSRAGMPAVERLMIVAGAVLGVIGSYLISITQTANAPQFDYSVLHSLEAPVRSIGFLGQLCLLGISLFYIARQRMPWSEALVLLLSINFFLPIYMSGADTVSAFTWTSFAHGTQYMAFLFFHSAAYGAGKSRFAMPVVFAATALILGDIYLFNVVIPTNFVSSFYARALGYDVGGTGTAIAVGILLTHFWIDSFVWRFKNPDTRSSDTVFCSPRDNGRLQERQPLPDARFRRANWRTNYCTGPALANDKRYAALVIVRSAYPSPAENSPPKLNRSA